MTGMTHALSRYDYLVKQCLDGKALLTEPPLAQHFGHLLGKPNEITGNLSHQAILDAYIALVDGMKTTTLTPGPAEAGMTFFGQFVDHDITLDATSSIQDCSSIVPTIAIERSECHHRCCNISDSCV